jgi:predicted transcriptional regulator
MKTNVRDTSILAYRTDVEPTLNERQQRVYDALLANDPLTNSEIAAYLNWPINCITPRIFELRRMGLVFEDKKRPCRVTGRTAYAWRVTKDTLF